MTWAKLDDAFPDHPKVDVLSDGAFRLHVAALCFCCRYLTDGFIASERVSRLTPRYRPAQAAELVEARLWEEAHDGWRIHDFLTYQPSAEKVTAEREAAAERMKAKRTKAERSGDVRANKRRTNGERSGEQTANVRDVFGDPVPSRPEPVLDQTQPPASSSVLDLGGEVDLCGSQGATPEAPQADPRFERFWLGYPRRNGKRIGRADAERTWKRLTHADRDQALAAVEHYAGACDAPDGPLAMDAHRWLTRKRWEDWLTPAVARNGNGHHGPSTSDFLNLAAQLREEGQ